MQMLGIVVAAAQLASAPVELPAELNVVRDPITDRISAIASVPADRGRLEIGCDPSRFGGVRVMIHSRYWLPRENIITGARFFTYRFDSAPPRQGRFSTSDRTAWLHGRNRTADFILRARSAQQLVVRLRDVEGRRLDLFFPLAEARPLIERALGICSGALPPEPIQLSPLPEPEPEPEPAD